jgi:hypothetical protein
LEKSPFESSHSIAERLLVAQSTVLRYLHESIWFKSFHLRWVPHMLSHNFFKMKGVYKKDIAILAYCRTW